MNSNQKKILKMVLMSLFFIFMLFMSFLAGLTYNGLIHIEAKGTVILEGTTGCYINTDRNVTYIASPGYLYSDQNYFLNICNMDNSSTYQLEVSYFSTAGPSIHSHLLASYNLVNSQETYLIPIPQLLQNITLHYPNDNLQFILLRNTSLEALSYTILIPFNISLTYGGS